MKTIELDVAILGAGTAGLRATRQILKQTDNYRIFEGGAEGTTCARVGCMPSKALIHLAEKIHGMNVAARLGALQGTEQVTVDTREVLSHVRSLRDRFVAGTIQSYSSFAYKMVKEYASFTAPMTLEAGGIEYKAKAIILGIGSTPRIPAGWKLIPEKIVTSETFFELQEIPKRVLVIGLGIIGAELGQAMAHLGCDVIGVTHSDNLVGSIDKNINDDMAEILGKSLQLQRNTKATLLNVGDGVQVELLNTKENTRKAIEVDLVLIATGRVPNFAQVNLPASGLNLDENGLPIFSPATLQCEPYPVFIAGDCADRTYLQHEAGDEGTFIGMNAVTLGSPKTFIPKVPLSIAFTEPNVCRVGVSATHIPQDSFVVGEADFVEQGRAKTMIQQGGRIMLYVDKSTSKIIGSEMAAPRGEHLAHQIAGWIANDMTVNDALNLPFYHPSLEEGIKSALLDAKKKLKK